MSDCTCNLCVDCNARRFERRWSALLDAIGGELSWRALARTIVRENWFRLNRLVRRLRTK